MRKLALHWKIIIGMGAGVLLALLAIQFDGGADWITKWIKPFGSIFINALKLIAIPLILSSLIKGVSDLSDLKELSKMGGKTIGLYLMTTVVAVSLGLLVANLIKPGSFITEETRTELIASFAADASSQIELAHQKTSESPLQPLVDIIPDNLFMALTNNSNMLQVIFFAIFIGICMTLIPSAQAKPVKDFFDSLNSIILKMIDIIMSFSPFGVFALMAGLIADTPNPDLFRALLIYAVTVCIALVIMLCLYMLGIKLYTGRSPKFFVNGIAPAQLLAFSTSSSAATLPVTMERTQDYLGVDKEISSFVLPIGATINMDGSSIYQAVSALFIAQAFGMDLSLGIQLGIIVTATLASIGTASVPGSAIVMLIIVLAQAGIPEAGLGLIFAIERPLDMMRTTVNITGDAAVAMAVAKSENKLIEPSNTLNSYKS